MLKNQCEVLIRINLARKVDHMSEIEMITDEFLTEKSNMIL